MLGITRNIGLSKVRLWSLLNPSLPSEIPDGAITTMNDNMIILSTNGDYILTINGFVPMNALMLSNGSFLKTLNNEFITI